MTKLCVIIGLAALALVITDARKLSFKSLECLEHNNEVCGDLSCSMGKKQKTVSLGCTMARPTDVMRWQVTMSYVNPKMKLPHQVTASGDFCDIVNGRIDSAAIKMGMPLLKTFIPQFTKECPYSGRLEVADFDPNEIMSVLPPLAPPGDYSAEVKVFNDRDELIIHPKVMFVVKK